MKPTTIEEVLVSFGNYIADEHDGNAVGKSRHDMVEVKRALATIEQLVLDEVIGRSEVIGKTGIRPAEVYNIRDDLRVEQRQALSQLLRGGDKS